MADGMWASAAAVGGARLVHWAWLGRAAYPAVLALQEEIREGILAGTRPETLLLVEHPSVITLGRNADPAHVLASPAQLAELKIPVIRVARGGDVTYHGPGQLVGYPVFRVRDGIRTHMTRIASAVSAVLAELGVVAEWRSSHPGLWLGDEKICAVGVHVRRGVAIHGFALNVDVDLGRFATIIPCGLRELGVTSMAKALGTPPAMDEVAARLVAAFARAFGVAMAPMPPSDSTIANRKSESVR